MRPQQRAWNAARQLLDELRIHTAPVPVVKIARRQATIARESLGDDVSGMLIPTKDGPVIVVNSDHSPTRQRFTIAHELGHLILHNYTTPHADRRYKVRFRDATSSEGTDVEEIEANQFAAALLMPKNLLIKKLIDIGFEHDPDEEDAEQLAEVAKAFNVSRQALSIRLSSLQLFW